MPEPITEEFLRGLGADDLGAGDWMFCRDQLAGTFWNKAQLVVFVTEGKCGFNVSIGVGNHPDAEIFFLGPYDQPRLLKLLEALGIETACTSK